MVRVGGRCRGSEIIMSYVHAYKDVKGEVNSVFEPRGPYRLVLISGFCSMK